MLKLFLLGAAIAALMHLVTHRAIAQESPALEKHVFADGANKLPYRLLKPVKVEEDMKYPLVIFLHGAGERGSDNEKQLVHGVPRFASVENRQKHPCFLIAPQCPEGKKWVEVDWSADTHTQPKDPGEVGRLTLALIEKAMKDLPVDPKRVYLTGLSMGGYGTWDFVARRPELFAAAAPVCGGADEATATKIKDIPIWAFHGAKDTAVKPARSRNIIAALKKAGGQPKYTEYPNVGHNSWDNAYSDPEFFKWLFAQKRD
jgi:predicted peptidase